MGADSDVVKRSVEWLEVYIEITVCIVTRVRVPWIWEINLLTCKRNFIKITLKISTSPRIIVAEVASRWGRMWHHSNMTETSFYAIYRYYQRILVHARIYQVVDRYQKRARQRMRFNQSIFDATYIVVRLIILWNQREFSKI